MNDRNTVESLYGALSNPTAPDLAERLGACLAPDWQSLGDYSGAGKSREAFTAQIRGFGQLIPDLRWDIVELIEAGERFVVRGRARGTPQGELFGVPPGGRSFDILSLDLHTVVEGHIARTWHVEDWATAMRQLAGR